MNRLLRLYGDWATLTPLESYTQTLLASLSPLLRVLLAGIALYILTSSANSKPRLQTALLFGILTAFYTNVELSPFLENLTNNNVADVSLKLLTLTSLLIGMAIGSLVPRFVGGVALGGVLGLLVGCVMSAVGGAGGEMMVGSSSVGLVASVGCAVLVGGIGFRYVELRLVVGFCVVLLGCVCVGRFCVLNDGGGRAFF